MPTEFRGRALFANGVAAPNVQVRIFDKDAPGKTDDDLTEIPGLSDEQGHFRLLYSITRYLDYNTFTRLNLLGVDVDWSSIARNIRLPDPTDVYLPYLQFRYVVEGQEQVHEVPLGLFQREFRLPHTVPMNFLPSVHGFKFINSFPGYPLPFSVPALPSTGNVPRAYGLCGGMSSAAYDFCLARRNIPQTDKPPRTGTRLHRYLYRRAIDTFGSFGESLVKVAWWMRLPEAGIAGSQKRTLDEFEELRARLDSQHAVILALIYTGADNLADIPREIWNNHQVLAYAWRQAGPDRVELRVYDPNYPLRDDVVIVGEKITAGVMEQPGADSITVYGLRCVQKVSNQVIRSVRGFFPMPYVPIGPPKGLE